MDEILNFCRRALPAARVILSLSNSKRSAGANRGENAVWDLGRCICSPLPAEILPPLRSALLRSLQEKRFAFLRLRMTRTVRGWQPNPPARMKYDKKDDPAEKPSPAVEGGPLAVDEVLFSR